MVKTVFLGAGQMAEALIKGLVEAKLYLPAEILASDISETRLNSLTAKYGIKTTNSNIQAVQEGEVVILAVKPQQLKAVVKEVGGQIKQEQTVVSIAAGVPLAKIKPFIKQAKGLVRVMPNTPALVGAGMTALAFEPQIDAATREKVKAIFAAVGEVTEVNEELLDVVTAVSGSGPAYYCLFCLTLAEAGIKAGLAPETAFKLSRQTFYGTSLLLKEGLSEAELIKKVASPGGTTEAALAKFKELGLEKLVTAAVQAAIKRGQELAELI